MASAWNSNNNNNNNNASTNARVNAAIRAGDGNGNGGMSASTSGASLATTETTATLAAAASQMDAEPPKGFAKRFLRRLGRKKEKYQSGKDPSELGPVPEDSAVSSPAKGSLAKKLLGQSKRGGRGSKKNTSGDLDRLSFRGNRLETSSIGGQSALDDLGSFGDSDEG